MIAETKTIALGLSGGLIGGALLLLLGNSAAPQNPDFQTQSAQSAYLFVCQQEIVYQDNTKEKLRFFSERNQTNARECIEVNACNNLKIISTVCREFQQQ